MVIVCALGDVWMNLWLRANQGDWDLLGIHRIAIKWQFSSLPPPLKTFQALCLLKQKCNFYLRNKIIFYFCVRPLRSEPIFIFKTGWDLSPVRALWKVSHLLKALIYLDDCPILVDYGCFWGLIPVGCFGICHRWQRIII